MIKEEKKRTAPLLLSEVNMDTYRTIRSFGPFGYDYPEPEFLIENLPVSSLRFSQDGRFLSTPLGKGVRLFSFSYGKPSLINSNDKVSLSGTLKLDEFRGQLQLTFRCEKK